MPLWIDFGNPDVAMLAALYAREGVEARPVGGSVRDRALSLMPKDFDFAVDALPEDVMAIADKHGMKVIPTGLKHGTVTVVVNGEGYEFTTLRTDDQTNGRHADVSFIKDFQKDAARRDFTINAMSADHTGKVHDYFGGLDDLSRGVVRYVGDPNKRMQEDYLRILRYYRFRARFGAGADDAGTMFAIRQNAEGLRQISVERVWKEVSQIFASTRAEEQLASMYSTAVTDAIGLPYSPSKIVNFRKVRKFTADPAILLGSLFPGGETAEQFASFWRLSKAERERCKTAAYVLGTSVKDPYYWRCKQYEGVDGSVAAVILKATGRAQAALAVSESAPVFPLQARDLIAVGREPGKELGLEIKRLENEWMGSGFSLSKERLVELSLEAEEKASWRLK
jgi:tRNA nucleotidyltransferase/poly(A) polymerase